MALSEKRKKYLRDWYTKDKKKQRIRIAKNKKQWRIKNIELSKKIDSEKNKKYRVRMLAYGKMRWAIQSGKLKRPKKCSKCEKKKRIYAHHPDYSKPLDVIWLCMDCHMAEHHN